MRSLRSSSFLMPAKTILVPGMNFLGCLRQSSALAAASSRRKSTHVLEILEECILVPSDAAVLVGVRVFKARRLARRATVHAVQIGALLVCAAFFNDVAAASRRNAPGLAHAARARRNAPLAAFGLEDCVHLWRRTQGL